MEEYQSTLVNLEQLMTKSCENKNISLAAAGIHAAGILIRSGGCNASAGNKKSLINQIEQTLEIVKASK